MIDDRTNHEMNSVVPTTEIKVESERPVVVALDRSSISVAAIVRVVAVTLVLLFIGGFLANIITSLNPDTQKAEGLEVEINEAALKWAGIDKLKYEKAAMPLADYRKQLATLLLQLAQIEEEIEK